MTSEKTMRFCNNCGAEIDARAKICPKCKRDIPKDKLRKSFMFGGRA
jgi:predicted amidophosphoribosyltransferase